LFHYDGGTQRTYQRMIHQMDLQIGRVLQALDAIGAGQDTIVIFTSDNGGERYSDTWPFTGIAGRRFADPGGDPMAGQNSVRRRLRAGDDRHGLVPHPARCRRHRSRPGVSIRRDQFAP
jgi:arylsulfatase A-like enzyme